MSVWLKEFIALVFTQTIQAFIYAIIISIILFGMGNDTGVSANDNNSALGLMATFALLSVFKVEEMTRKIFGIGETKASQKNAMKSLAKTAIAAKLGKRVLNNAGKVFGGIRSINKASHDRAKTKKRLEEDMSDNGFKLDENGKPVYEGKSKKSSSTSGSEGTDGGPEDTDEAEESSGSDSGKGSGSKEKDNQMSDAARRRMRNAVRNYEDKLDEINNARNEGIKQICSGFAESVGATFGATAGGILGGSDGNLDEMLQGVLAGAGVGDAVGEMTVDGVDRAIKFVKRNSKPKERLSSSALKQRINEYDKAIKDLDVYYKDSVDDDD